MHETVIYCDDQPRYLEEFRKRHDQDFRIETCERVQDVHARLSARGTLPDLLLLDLYHPRDTPNHEELARVANAQLRELSEKIREVKGHVDAAWAPVGIQVLREVRQHYPSRRLPVMIYTQRGLALLDDLQLREIEQLGAEWLIKDRERITPTTEAIRIRRHIELCRGSRRISRDVTIAAVFSVVGAVLGVVLSAVMRLV